MKVFKQFMSPWHPVTSKQEHNISSQKNWFAELGFTSYNTSKVLYSIFQDSPWFFFFLELEALQRNSLAKPPWCNLEIFWYE